MSQIKDEKQEYQYATGWTTPSGHEFHFYDTPENERFVVKHSSGSHIEFKADGSIFVKSLKDLHWSSSVVSKASDGETTGKASEVTTQRIGTNYTIDCLGEFNLKCRKFNLEVGETAHIYAGEDLEMKANNVWTRATEAVSVEGQKAIHMDTDQYTARMVSQKTELGTFEDGGKGGINILNLNGHSIINNKDENGGITIASKGYLNLVCGQERVDVTGKYEGVWKEPEKEGKATFTTKIYKPEKQNKQDVNKEKPGDYYFESEAGATYIYGKKYEGSKENPEDGRHVKVEKGNDILTIMDGDKETNLQKGKWNINLQKGDFEWMINGNWKRTVTGMEEDTTSKGRNSVYGKGKTETIGAGGGGGGGFYFSDYNPNLIVTPSFNIHEDPCTPDPLPPNTPIIPGLPDEDDSSSPENNGGEGGGSGGGGGGGFPNLPIGTLLQMILGDNIKKVQKNMMFKATKIFLN